MKQMYQFLQRLILKSVGFKVFAVQLWAEKKKVCCQTWFFWLIHKHLQTQKKEKKKKKMEASWWFCAYFAIERVDELLQVFYKERKQYEPKAWGRQADSL